MLSHHFTGSVGVRPHQPRTVSLARLLATDPAGAVNHKSFAPPRIAQTSAHDPHPRSLPTPAPAVLRACRAVAHRLAVVAALPGREPVLQADDLDRAAGWDLQPAG